MKPSYRIAELERIGDAFRQRAIEAERERDEAIAAHRKHAASLIADRGLLRERAEAAERERDELLASKDWYEEAAKGLNSRLLKAETELARRDAAAAGEVVHLYREHNPCNGMKTDWIEIDSEQLASLKESTDPETAEFRTLHDAAQPAVRGNEHE